MYKKTFYKILSISIISIGIFFVFIQAYLSGFIVCCTYMYIYHCFYRNDCQGFTG